jgi:hypothetical protein
MSSFGAFLCGVDIWEMTRSYFLNVWHGVVYAVISDVAPSTMCEDGCYHCEGTAPHCQQAAIAVEALRAEVDNYLKVADLRMGDHLAAVSEKASGFALARDEVLSGGRI